MTETTHPFDWKTLNSNYVLKDRWIAVRADTVQMPNGRVLDPFYALEYPDYVNMVGITTDKQVILVRQYRHGVQRTVLEIPAGMMDPKDASPLAAAQREMREETGYTSEQWIQLPSLSPNSANHRNMSHQFLALNMVLNDEQTLDDSEQLEIIQLSIEETITELHAGAFLTAAHTGALFFALAYMQSQKPFTN
ncbi:MAG: NUDIX hydrolase [Candidatus Promineifilaceae bacterium]